MRTTLIVRPAARGGKYLGPDAADLAYVSAMAILSDYTTGQQVTANFVLTNPPQDSGPATLMTPVSRAAPFATDSNTVFTNLTVDISEPTTYCLSVYGPYKYGDQAALVRSTITLLPGVHIGDSAYYPEGLVIEIPGLCISNVTAVYEGALLSCSAMVTMMCGCHIGDNSNLYWPASDFTIQLVTYMQSGAVYSYPLHYDTTPGQSSTFIGDWPSQAASGDSVLQAWVFASQPKLGNQGRYAIYPYNPNGTARPAEVESALALVECRQASS